jgi:hypothetical protein
MKAVGRGKRVNETKRTRLIPLASQLKLKTGPFGRFRYSLLDSLSYQQ